MNFSNEYIEDLKKMIGNLQTECIEKTNLILTISTKYRVLLDKYNELDKKIKTELEALKSEMGNNPYAGGKYDALVWALGEIKK